MHLHKADMGMGELSNEPREMNNRKRKNERPARVVETPDST